MLSLRDCFIGNNLLLVSCNPAVLILLLITELEAAYHTLADFADSEYERLKAHMKSPEFQNKLSLQKIQQEQAGELDKIRDKQTRELRYAWYMKQSLVCINLVNRLSSGMGELMNLPHSWGNGNFSLFKDIW